MKRAPDWLPPLAGAILAAGAMHGAWLVSRAAGYVPDCIPHLEGCHSVSEAARNGAANGPGPNDRHGEAGEVQTTRPRQPAKVRTHCQKKPERRMSPLRSQMTTINNAG